MKRFILCIFWLAVEAAADIGSVDETLHNSNNAFTAKMFTEVVNQNPDKSVVLSAFSVLTPLAQLALASVGESHDELLATIGMPNDNITKAVFSGINTHLRSVKGVTIKAASKIFIAKNYELNSDFAVITRDVFGSEVANVDFIENKKTAKEINLWVEEQTNNRIQDLVDPASLDASTKALLVNAIYFKGLWKIPFKKQYTMNRSFHVSKNNLIEVPTMWNKDNYRYFDSQELHAQVLELKYVGEESALYIVLPHELDGIRKLEEKLKVPSLLNNVFEKMYETEVVVFLPKFKIETKTDVKQILENMKVRKIFNAEEARLDNLLKTINSGLYISDAIQKAFIEVNEEGAEAAAANVFDIVYTSLIIDEPPPPQFIADRPFYFVVKEKSLSLFNGIYAGN